MHCELTNRTAVPIMSTSLQLVVADTTSAVTSSSSICGRRPRSSRKDWEQLYATAFDKLHSDPQSLSRDERQAVLREHGEAYTDLKAADAMQRVQLLIRRLHQVRGELKVPLSKRTKQSHSSSASMPAIKVVVAEDVAAACASTAAANEDVESLGAAVAATPSFSGPEFNPVLVVQEVVQRVFQPVSTSSSLHSQHPVALMQGVLRIDDEDHSFTLNKQNGAHVARTHELLETLLLASKQLPADSTPPTTMVSTTAASLFSAALAFFTQDYLDNNAKALPILKQLEQQRQCESAPELASTDLKLAAYQSKVCARLGNAYRCTRNYKEALLCLQRAYHWLEVVRGTGRHRALRASTAVLLGKTYLAMQPRASQQCDAAKHLDDLRTAKHYLEQGVDIYEGLVASKHPAGGRIAWAMHNLMRVHLMLGELAHLEMRCRALEQSSDPCIRSLAGRWRADLINERAWRPSCPGLLYTNPVSAKQIFIEAKQQLQEAATIHAAVLQCSCTFQRDFDQKTQFFDRYINKAAAKEADQFLS